MWRRQQLASADAEQIDALDLPLETA
jgi:hypothetical protein